LPHRKGQRRFAEAMARAIRIYFARQDWCLKPDAPVASFWRVTESAC
jgi:hypothetical protein